MANLKSRPKHQRNQKENLKIRLREVEFTTVSDLVANNIVWLKPSSQSLLEM